MDFNIFLPRFHTISIVSPASLLILSRSLTYNLLSHFCKFCWLLSGSLKSSL